MTWVPNKAGTDAMSSYPINVDTPYTKVNRWFTNEAAVLAAAPLYPGECVVGQDTMDTYQGCDTTVGHWQKQAVKQ